MTRSDLVEELASRFSQLTHRDAEYAVKTILDAMSDALVRGHRIEIRGFGSFSISRRPPRLGRNPRSVDFLIATEAEMRKVNWSTRREVMNSTGVVIVTMLAIAVFSFVCDRAFAWSFLQVGVLDSSVLDTE